MKYILAKDLPMASKGNEVFINSVNKFCYAKLDKKWEDLFFPRTALGYLHELLNDGWIEEVKPREIWLNSIPDGLYGARWFDDKELAKKYAETYWRDREVKQVKFIEVIE